MPPCPSCGRDAGSNELCPHCGADIQRRMRIRTFGVASIVVALIGLAVLWVFATHAPIAQPVRVLVEDDLRIQIAVPIGIWAAPEIHLHSPGRTVGRR